ncbi:efflux RND transporter periplasmic adaptor subunit [Stieleria sp. JC731]|uniref:efflux RND transporter periplasmic adaptor subunit n=1 Tax=Pirellulaceae TaxID=2691357 RepID=UPI001E647647|nr:efflux RND transporter periplasmic adaptor subunit [Stieleria sp. JC731]MCC9599228.1 efflux RND transporter periplasmic adaptor subunit [Stieleria sp. JC731]
MKRFLKWIIVLLVLGGIGAAVAKPVKQYWKERNRLQWETAAIVQGDITRYVNSTGAVRPVRSVSVGSFVSGPIVELNVDFNDKVQAGEVLARVDPRLFKAEMARAEAALATREAELERIEAELQQAVNNFDRGKKLREKREGFLSESEMDSLTFQVKSLQAQRKVAEATILQAKASLDNAMANLNYCEITAPVDGIVIDRKIDPGQTLAAQFQTPELFVVAPDLRQSVHVFASVDEADIGLVQRAQSEKRPVTFTVDAHPDVVFEGTIEQIRVSSASTQNVVTYPVVIETANPDLKLLPGMTASISFEVDSTEGVAKIPNTALRFYPEDAAWVREQDRHLVDGSIWKKSPEAQQDDGIRLSAIEKTKRSRQRNQRHVWVVEGDLLKAVKIQTGLTESGFTELQSGDLSVGDVLVTGKKS